MKKAAFTLIELMVSLLIASFLVMTLTLILQQTGKARQFVDIVVANGLLRTTLFEELSHDFSGMITKKPAPKKEGEKTEQKLLPPIEIKRSPDGIVEEFSFLTTNARAYKPHRKVMHVRYKLTLIDKAKKIYTITRFVTEPGKKDQQESVGVAFLDTITAFNIAFIQQQKKDETAEKKEAPFAVVKEWPLQKKEEAKKETLPKKEEQGVEKKPELEKKKEEEKTIVTHMQITVAYSKNRKGTPEVITMLLPLYNTSEVPDIVMPKKEERKKEQEKTKTAKKEGTEEKEEESDEITTTSPFSQNSFQKSMMREELVVLEDRTTKMINSIFKVPSV